MTSPAAADVLGVGDHGSTFAGGPLVSAAALAAFDVLDDAELLRRVRDLGARLREGLIVNPIGSDTLRFLPPLVIGEAEIDEALEILRRTLG